MKGEREKQIVRQRQTRRGIEKDKWRERKTDSKADKDKKSHRER